VAYLFSASLAMEHLLRKSIIGFSAGFASAYKNWREQCIALKLDGKKMSTCESIRFDLGGILSLEFWKLAYFLPKRISLEYLDILEGVLRLPSMPSAHTTYYLLYPDGLVRFIVMIIFPEGMWETLGIAA